MEIVKERSDRVFNLRLSGRLDHHWSQSLDDALEEVIREGARHVRIDLSDVSYLSSAGAGVLLKGYQQASALQGTFKISAVSDRVRDTIRLMELDELFFGETAGETVRRGTLSVPLPLVSERATFESRVLDLTRSACYLVGDPTRLSQAPYGKEQTAHVSIRSDVFALGVGALGSSYDECRGLFGEFVGAAGSAAFMPTDGTPTPDYMSSTGELVPKVRALYAITFRGAPAYQIRFEASTPANGVPLSEIIQACASTAGTNAVGIVMAAEVAGLVSARLRRSPALTDAARFDFPAVREWLSFTREREYARFSSVVVGVASASPSAEMRPFLRPVSDALHGHFHAVVTAFRSLPRGKLNIAETVAESLQPRGVFSVVHLLRDARPFEGAGESEFQRGACWVFPLDEGEDS